MPNTKFTGITFFVYFKTCIILVQDNKKQLTFVLMAIYILFISRNTEKINHGIEINNM